jgi:hypothetical protein
VGDNIGLSQNFEGDGNLVGLGRNNQNLKFWISADHPRVKMKPASTPTDSWGKCGSDPQVKNDTHTRAPVSKIVILSSRSPTPSRQAACRSPRTLPGGQPPPGHPHLRWPEGRPSTTPCRSLSIQDEIAPTPHSEGEAQLVPLKSVFMTPCLNEVENIVSDPIKIFNDL